MEKRVGSARTSVSKRQTLLERADVTRQEVGPRLVEGRREALGQYMTPANVAAFMASMFENVPPTVNLLDAGAGFGALTAAFVHEMCGRSKRPQKICVTTFEIEPALAEALDETLKACGRECRSAGISFESQVVRDDFILAAASPMFSDGMRHTYDCAILNPPYAKIQSSSLARKALRTLGIETSNLYTAFVAIAIKRLRPGGQVVAITPRSFCNGPYFLPFRELLLHETSLKRIHVYESRKKAFSDDAVLQENVIYSLEKGSVQRKVLISSSHGPADDEFSERRVPYEQVVLPGDPNLFIRITASEADGALAERVRALPWTLRDLGISVSTGRVVDFRALDFIQQSPVAGAVPLIYPTHFDAGFIKWPKLESKKANAIEDTERTRDLLVPAGMYVLTKRFSSKEERRRLVAALYDPSRVAAPRVGFENHLNYFHWAGKGLPELLAKGLAVFLNSTAVDQYFRQFSGHTQVNATDLRQLHYPSVAQLEAIGAKIEGAMPVQEEADSLVAHLFSAISS